MQTATVFNMQKFSLNDGPGIRTVVFLKGCPLRCAWCANPESQRRAPQLQWRDAACVGCGACVAILGGEAVAEPDGRRHVDVRRADASGPRVAEALARCPGEALSVVGETKTVDEVLAFCLQDRPFYEDSGGGVTLSGGEAMVWPEFCLELLGRLADEGVDTCAETEAHVPPATFDAVCERLDHLLVDMKHANPVRHRAATGVALDLIGRNTRHAIEAGKDVLVRTPVIPGFNDAPDDARAMARRLLALGATRVQLLPFHPLGESKYELLGRPYAYAGTDALRAEALEGYRQAWVEEGVEAFF